MANLLELKSFQPTSKNYEIPIEDQANDYIPSNHSISIAWRNLQYELPGNRLLQFCGHPTNIVLLRRLTGNFRFHSLNAFLGPSGSGKTTLLNCLNGSLTTGLTKNTEIYISTENITAGQSIRFVRQHVQETIFGKMTARQILTYAFWFKNQTKDYPKMDKHIETVLKELLLDDPRILDQQFKICSGGEQRRLAIAQELMSLEMPTFLLIDEPTTGLDSNAAYLLMKCLRQLANDHPMTIFTSVHAPSTDIMNLFDKIYVLAKGGVCIYSGSPSFLRQHLQQQFGYEEFKSTVKKPPIEEYLKIACNGFSDETVRNLANFTLAKENHKLFRIVDDNCLVKLKFLSKGIRLEYKRFCWKDFRLQLSRMFLLTFWIDGRKFAAILAMFALFFFIYSTMFDSDMVRPSTCLFGDDNSGANSSLNICKEKLNDEIQIHAYIGYQTFAMVYLGLFVCAFTGHSFATILKVFQNEHRNRTYQECFSKITIYFSTDWYSMSTFYWPIILVYLFQMTILALHFTMLFYFNVDHLFIDHGDLNLYRFGSFLLFIFCNVFYLQSFGQLFGLMFMERIVLVCIVSVYFYMFLHVCDGYQLKQNLIKNPVILFQSELFAIKSITYGMLYTFYGLNRCDDPQQISYVLIDYNIDTEQVYTALWKIAINCLIIRSCTLFLMASKFCWNFSRKTFTRKQSTNKEYYLKPIDFGTFVISLENHQNEPQGNTIERTKQEKEIIFQQLVKDKIIVAWHSLSLFDDESIFEIRKAKYQDFNLQERKNGKISSKLILRNLNGQFRFNTLNALMGPSGAGKTSLLKVLNGQLKTRLSYETEFYITKYTSLRTCYLEQEVGGHLLPGLTTKQSLIYASKLKNSFEDSNNIDHQQIALNLMNELDIADSANIQVSKLSGGQRKRLALALEMTAVHMPNFICIDEPTSGLDSNSAEMVIGCLSRLVKHHNMTMVVSIHQPNTEILMMFDQIYVLAKGGVQIYSGPPTKIPKYLKQLSNYFNQDEMISSLVMNKTLYPIEKLIKYSCLNHLDRMGQSTKQEVNQNVKNIHLNDVQMVLDGIPLNRICFSLKSVSNLFGRYLFHVKGFLWVPYVVFILLIIFYAVMMANIFYDEIAQRDGCLSIDEDLNNTCSAWDPQEKQDLEANFHYTFYVNNIFLLLILTGSSFMFSMQSIYFSNEHRNGWYSTGAFYLVKTVADMSVIMISLIIYFYFVTSIHQQIRSYIYHWMLLVMFFASVSCNAVGNLCAVVFGNNVAMLSMSTMGIFLISAMNTNYFTHYTRLNYVWQLVSTLNLFRYHNEASVILQYGFNRCRPREIQVILNHFQIIHDEPHLYWCLLMNVFNAILYQSLAFLAIYFKTNQTYPHRRHRTEHLITMANEQNQIKTNKTHEIY